MILGGGAGTRLFPLTEERSKPAVPVGAKYRLIDIPISNCLNSGVKRMYVLTQFNSASLNKHIKNTYNFDMFGTAFVDILAAEQTKGNYNWFQGTADAVRQCFHHLNNYEHEYVLVLSGDQLYQMNFKELGEFHVDKDADLTIATIPVNADDATGFGIMKVDNDGIISDFVEKPSKEELKNWSSPVSSEHKEAGKEYLASMGIYIFKKEAIKKLFDTYKDATDFGKEIIPTAIKDGYKVASYEYTGYWTDIGTVKSFFEANLELASPMPEINLFDRTKNIFTRPRQLAPSKIFNAKLDESLIAEGCVIHANEVKKSVIGIRSRVGENTNITESYIFGNDWYESLENLLNEDTVNLGVGNNCVIHKALIDKNCRIGDNVTIIGGDDAEHFEGEDYWIRDGIVVIKKGRTIAPGTTIGLPVASIK